MKNIFFVLLFVTTIFANSQEIAKVLAAGKEDGSKYLESYLQPVFKGFIYDMSSGWYHSGKTHKKFGFDITINANAAFVPDEDKIFSFKNEDYDFLKLDGVTSADLPTVMGGKSNQNINIVIPVDAAGIVLPPESAATRYRVSSFETLNGIEEDLTDAVGVAAVPAPMVQFGIGLPSKTDLKIRYIPSVGADNVSLSLYGIGLQHNLLQHFKIVDKVPIIDVSLLGAFTKATIVHTPKDINSSSIVATNQETTIKINSYTAQIVGNVNLKVINFYAGIGYVAGSSTTKVKGDYTYTYNIEDENGDPIPGVPAQTVTIKDPIDLEYTVNGMKTTIGMRLNILWFKMFADYSIQQYNTANVGIAFSFR